MKVIIISILLLVSIVGDFTSYVFAVDNLDTSCHISVCSQSDLHSNNQKDNHNQKAHETHCHASHVHVVTFYSTSFNVFPLASYQSVQF